uniref:PIPK domain-containing protein n=1 Tax=Pseudo-nitzschia australis TaxID=44445 RepID=A0A7S4APM4_9STRA
MATVLSNSMSVSVPSSKTAIAMIAISRSCRNGNINGRNRFSPSRCGGSIGYTHTHRYRYSTIASAGASTVPSTRKGYGSNARCNHNPRYKHSHNHRCNHNHNHRRGILSLPSTSLPLSLPTSTTASSSSSRHLFFSTTSSSLEEEENARRNAENAGRQQQRLAEASLSRARNSTSPLLSASGGGDPLSRAPAGLPPGARIHSDFFGEPVTFLDGQSSASSTSADTASPSPDIAPAVASLDGFLIGIVSRGKAFTGGGEEQGISAQAYHSAALAWSDLIRHASVWNGDDACCPMLVHAAVAPVLAQSGAAYVRHLDRVLEHVDLGVDNGNTTVSLMQLAEKAVAAIQSNDNGNDKDNNNDRSVPPLTPREITHLTALGCLLRNDHRRAMLVLYRHVQVCPGDALALSLLLDVCHTVGDTGIAMRGAAAVAAYWSERGGGMIRPSGHGAVAGLIAVGLAVGGRTAEAEALAIEHAGSKRSLAAGVATWAMAHVLDSGGRTAEGVSACANLDGSERYEDCGFLGFDAVLAGYGVRFALDREDRGGRSRGSAALRLYDTHYGAVLEGSGYSNANASSGHDKPHQRAPIGWRRSRFEASNRAQELMAEVFGKEQRSVYERESSNAGANNQNENNENERNGNGVGNENENNNEQQASSSYTTMSYGDTTTNGNNNNNNNNNSNDRNNLVSFQSNSKGAARSGGVFFFTADGAYLIKTIPEREKHAFLAMLPSYHRHMKQHGKTSLLTRFCGMYGITIQQEDHDTTSGSGSGSNSNSGGTTIPSSLDDNNNNNNNDASSSSLNSFAPTEKEYTFVVMNAVFPAESNRFISERFDLKGSTVGREVSKEELRSKGTMAVLKDLDLKREVDDRGRDIEDDCEDEHDYDYEQQQRQQQQQRRGARSRRTRRQAGMDHDLAGMDYGSNLLFAGWSTTRIQGQYC